MPHVLKLLAGALDSKFHPQYPGDEDFKMHKILKEITCGNANESASGLSLTITGEVGEQAAEMAGAAANRLAELPDMFTEAAAKAKAKAKSKSKPKTAEQTAMAEAKAAAADRNKQVTIGRKKIHTAIAGITTLTHSLSVGVGGEQLTPMDHAVNATLAELLQLLQTMDTSLTAADANLESALSMAEITEDPSLWIRVAASMKSAKTHIQSLMPAPKAKAKAKTKKAAA